MSVTVYVLANAINHELYTGISKDPDARLKQHNSGTNLYTKAFMPWKIIYTEVLNGYDEARKREKYLKSAAGKRYLKKQLGR